MNMYGDSIMFWGSGVCIKPAIRATGSRNDATANALQARLRVRVRELDFLCYPYSHRGPTHKEAGKAYLPFRFPVLYDEKRADVESEHECGGKRK